MGRLSLSLRLVLIVVGAMFVLQLITVAVQISRDDGFSIGGIRPSFAREVSTLVRLFDRMPPRRQAMALEFLNAGRQRLDIVAAAPAPDPGGPLLSWSARSIERRIAEEGIAPDRVEVSHVPTAGGDETRGPLARIFGRHLRITSSASTMAASSSSIPRAMSTPHVMATSPPSPAAFLASLSSLLPCSSSCARHARRMHRHQCRGLREVRRAARSEGAGRPRPARTDRRHQPHAASDRPRPRHRLRATEEHSSIASPARESRQKVDDLQAHRRQASHHAEVDQRNAVAGQIHHVARVRISVKEPIHQNHFEHGVGPAPSECLPGQGQLRRWPSDHYRVSQQLNSWTFITLLVQAQ